MTNNFEDRFWTEKKWKNLLDFLVKDKLLSYKEITSLVLGHINPSQVGTSVASNKAIQKNYPPRKCWSAVRKWHFNQRW